MFFVCLSMTDPIVSYSQQNQSMLSYYFSQNKEKMTSRREITFTKHANTKEEFLKVKEESITNWQKEGHAAIIAATWELSLFSYQLNNKDELDFKMDRTKIEKKRVPWLDGEKNG